jgi:anti-anti-sigma factor
MLLIEATERPRGYRLRGEIDLTAGDALARILQRAVDRNEPLHLDLSDVTFLDSIGLAVVIRTALSLEGRANLVLHAPQQNVRRTLEISGALRVPNVEVLD